MRYKHKRNYIYFLILSMLFFITFLGVGYSKFSKLLKITGSANTIPVNNKLHVQVIKLDTANNRYVNIVKLKNFNFISETLIENELSANYQAQSDSTGGGSSTLTFSIKNISNLQMTKGTTSVSTQGLSSNINNVFATLDRVTINAGNSAICTVNFKTDTKNLSIPGKASTRIIVSYVIGGATKYFYFNVILLAY